MATLNDLKTPFHFLAPEEALKMIMSVRNSRRISKRVIKATKSPKTKVTKPVSVDDLSPEQKLQLLKLLEDRENGE